MLWNGSRLRLEASVGSAGKMGCLRVCQLLVNAGPGARPGMSALGLGRVKTALGMSARAVRVRVFQAAIAVISGLTPTRFMTRVKL
jgi:hypothetical protein